MSGAADASGGEEALALGAAGETSGRFFFFRQRDEGGAASRRYFKPNLSHKEMDWTLLDRSRLAFSSWRRRASASVAERGPLGVAAWSPAGTGGVEAGSTLTAGSAASSPAGTGGVEAGSNQPAGSFVAWTAAASGTRSAAWSPA